MKLTPNIDERGCRRRTRGGIAVLVLGAVLLGAWAIPTGDALPWSLGLVGLAAGAFMIFEGRNAWCVLRALGFKTRI